jgi:cyclase
MLTGTATLPISEHFKLKNLDKGVYAAIASAGGGAGSNAGIIDLGDQTLVLDTFLTPIAASDLRSAAEQLIGRPITGVINSHAHSDHVCGNQMFSSQTPIIATRQTREAIPGMTAYLKEIKADPSALEKEIIADMKSLEIETDAGQRARLTASISRQRFVLTSLGILEIRLPDQTFEDELVFSGTQRKAILRTQGKGHSDSDAYLVLPEEHIIFMGDLGFFQTQPFMTSCDPQAWIRQLEDLERSDYKVFVPGHGPVETKADVTRLREYITAIEQMVTQAVTQGKTIEEVLQLPVPAPYDANSANERRRFERNVRSLYQRRK